MENECEALPGVAYLGVRDNCSTINNKTGYMMMFLQSGEVRECQGVLRSQERSWKGR